MSEPYETAAALVTSFEGFSATPYQDVAGCWTIGYGSTRDAAGQAVSADTPPISQGQATMFVMRDLQAAFAAVNDNVHVPLTANQTAACVDFIYNLGVGHFAHSTLLRLLNAGDYAGAAAQFTRWDQSAGHVIAGLLRRRVAEENLFNQADPS
ncbi:MAG: hypothetical protein B7Z78_11705 [Rhodospirillales bacterium 20-60-12]|nr:MAG: hypothetical protein B7Z78_11705 [Rhodospirillales bacterium 20-60-12]OYV62828.1 MAG: hypothetical protein B7X01_00980 [Acidiphilium sp. 21-62-4]HQT66005.1 lysozyme [Acetobacteraceae bacterium]HQU01956.1 lysozyme [Acetobacteraceae bacterium]